MAEDPGSRAEPAWRNEDGYEICLLVDCEPAGPLSRSALQAIPAVFPMARGSGSIPNTAAKGCPSRPSWLPQRSTAIPDQRNEDVPGLPGAGYAAHRATHSRSVRDARESGTPVPGHVRDEHGLGEKPTITP
jgi:hypothetical protein